MPLAKIQCILLNPKSSDRCEMVSPHLVQVDNRLAELSAGLMSIACPLFPSDRGGICRDLLDGDVALLPSDNRRADRNKFLTSLYHIIEAH